MIQTPEKRNAAGATAALQSIETAMKSLTETQSFSIPVFGRFTRGWPETDPSEPWRPEDAAVCVDVAAAFATRFVGDAHFVAYAGVAFRATSGLFARGGRVTMALAVFDVDAPDHAAPTPEWIAAERAKIERLRRLAPGLVSYFTRGGYRLVWLLDTPQELGTSEDAAAWTSLYLGWCSWLEHEVGIVADRRCADWTHIFRLPLVRRDGVDQISTVEGTLDAGRWRWSTGIELAPPPAPTAHAVIDESDEQGDPAIVDPLLDQIVGVLDAAGLWSDGRQSYFLTLAGWMLAKGWTKAELERLVERLPSKVSKYRAAVRRARPLDGPGAIVGLLPADAMARLDAIVNAHPLNEANRLRALIPAQAPAPAPIGNDRATPVAAEKPKRRAITTAGVVDVLSTGEWCGVLAFDALGGRVVCLREPPMRPQDNPGVPCAGEWTDAHTARARTWIFKATGAEPSKDSTDAAVEIVARCQTFHPVQTYLASLRWDGAARIEGFLPRYFGAEASEYTRQVGAKTLIAAVARAMRPGAKVDTMLILEGAQGIGKSRSLQALAPRAEWFADTPLDLESKDAAQCLQGKWIYEIGELHSFNRTETTRIKAFVSSESDNLRPSYGRRNQDFPRQCVFIGTTNGSEYLTDTTGNRRYWPVRCRAVDVEGIQRDRDQLWAEALARYNAGERWWLQGSEAALAEAQQVEREAIDPWEGPIVAWLEQPPAGSTRATFFTMNDVLTGALRLGAAEQSQATATRVGKLLARLGWRTRAVKDPATKKVTRLYMRAV